MEHLSLKCILIALSPLFLCNCSHQRIQKTIPDEKNITTVDFSSILSTTDGNGKTVNIIDEKESIYFCDSMVMYQIPVYATVSWGIAEDTTTRGSDSGLPASFNYVVFREKEDSIGFSYTSMAGPIRDTVSKNSFLSNGFRNCGGKFMQTNKFNRLIRSQKNRDSILEVYIPSVKVNDSFSDTTYLYYRKDLNDIKFDLVSELDSLKKMKLYKVLAIFNGNPQSTDPAYRHPRQLRLEVDKKKVSNQELIASLFKRFEKDYLTYTAGRKG